MATLWMDGFDTSGYGGEYTFSVTQNLSGGRDGNGALTGNDVSKTLATGLSTVFFSFAQKSSSRPGYLGNGEYFFLREGSTTHIKLVVNTSNKLEIRTNSDTILATSSAIFWVSNTWKWLQAKVVISDTVGSVEVRDGLGNVIVSVSSVDTRNGGTGVVNTFWSYYYELLDDLHIWDTSGSDVNTWTNETRVSTLRPSAAGDSTQFTSSAGNNWDCVNDTTVSATDYVSSSTAAHVDLYGCTDLSYTPATIFGVQRSAMVSKDDAGARTLKLNLKSNTTTDTGSAQALTFGSWTRISDVVPLDPATSAAWTPSAINAVQIGYENV